MTDRRDALPLIADIAGYTRFMTFHRASVAHAQEIVAWLLEVVVDAAGPALRLAKACIGDRTCPMRAEATFRSRRDPTQVGWDSTSGTHPWHPA